MPATTGQQRGVVQPASERRHVFISSTRADRPWLRGSGQELQLWQDSQIAPGTKWREAIETALAEAKLALLLVSHEFLASEFVMNMTVSKLLAAAQAEGVRTWMAVLSWMMMGRMKQRKVRRAGLLCGSWLADPGYCRSTYRFLIGPVEALNTLGFRVTCLPQGPCLMP